MDPSRLDRLARALATGAPRRAVLRGLLGAAVAAVVPSRRSGRAGDPTPTPSSEVPTEPHGAPEGIDFHGCPPEGEGVRFDEDLNRLKNRVDVPPEDDWASVAVAAILALPTGPSTTGFMR